MNSVDMRDQYNSWSEEEQLRFFDYVKTLKNEHSISTEENRLLKEALKEFGGVTRE